MQRLIYCDLVPMTTMTTAEVRRINPALIGGAVLLLGVLVFFGLRSLTRETVQVRVSPVTHENLISTVSTNGKVEPIAEYQAHASAPGVVEKVYVSVGQKVKAGDLILKMDDADALARVAAAKSNLAAVLSMARDVQDGGNQLERLGSTSEVARARLQQQQNTDFLANIRRLQEKGAASASEVGAAEQRLQAANTFLNEAQQRSHQRYSSLDVDHAKAQLSDAYAGLEVARTGYAKDNIKAPFAGTVYSLPVNAYDFVPFGEALVDLADLDRIQIRAYFDEPDIGRLARGEAVKIVWDAKPNQVWHGHIDRAPTTVISYGTRSVGECIITVDDAHGDLLPNTNVTVTVTTAQRFNALSIPREALHTEGANEFVYRVINNRLVRTTVQVGVANLTRAEITSGLSEHDVVALGATSNRDLTAGLEVSTIE